MSKYIELWTREILQVSDLWIFGLLAAAEEILGKPENSNPFFRFEASTRVTFYKFIRQLRYKWNPSGAKNLVLTHKVVRR